MKMLKIIYKVKKGKKFYVADPGKGLVKYNLEEFKKHWISTRSDGEEKGIAMFLEPTPAFYFHKEDCEGEKNKNPRSFRFLFGRQRASGPDHGDYFHRSQNENTFVTYISFMGQEYKVTELIPVQDWIINTDSTRHFNNTSNGIRIR